MQNKLSWSSEELEILQKLEPFSRLPATLQEETVNAWERCTARPGELIIKKGQTDYTHLYVIFDGIVRVGGGSANRPGASDSFGPILGMQGLLNGFASQYDALIALPTIYARLPAAWFRQLCDRDSNFAAGLRREFGPKPEPSDAGNNLWGVDREPFVFLQKWHGDRPWGSVLDAGTGESSLRWIMGLSTDRWTAVTGDPHWTIHLKTCFGSRFREQDKLIEHNWTDELLLKEEQFDIVLADYLLGAVERFAPYFQIKLWSRLRPNVGKFLYITGIEPYELVKPVTPGGELLLSIIRLRDSLMLMTGKPRFREYPLSWVEHTLLQAGFVVETTETFAKHLGIGDIHIILDNCLRLLPDLCEPDLTLALAHRINSLRQQVMSLSESHFGIRLGHDYAVVARPV